MIGPRRDREPSWLAFEDRVLQEAENPEVPLYERINFPSIFSSNLDGFLRVRVAALLGQGLPRLQDRPRARIIDSAGENPYPSPAPGVVSAREAHRRWLRERDDPPGDMTSP